MPPRRSFGSTVSLASKLLFGAGPGAFPRRRGTYVGAANVAPPLGESEAESTGIAANRRVSAAFGALVPEMEAICGGGSIFRRAERQAAHVQGFRESG